MIDRVSLVRHIQNSQDWLITGTEVLKGEGRRHGGVPVPEDAAWQLNPHFRRLRYLRSSLLAGKRAGRGNVRDGATAVPPGSCAVECPACPHPGKNLPGDWQTAPASRR